MSDWYYPKLGGVASHMHGLAVELRRLGHEVAVVTNDVRTGMEGELEAMGIELIRIPGAMAPILGINLSYSLKSANELTPYLEGFEVVHAHHAFTPLSLKAVKAGRALGTATVLTTHSISLAHESGLWKTLGLTFPLFSGYLRLPDRIIAVSRAAKAFIEHFTPVPVEVIPNGVDCRRFRPPRDREEVKEEFGISGRVLLYVGRMDVRKGPQILLNSFSRLREGEVTLVMVGRGPLLPLLRAQAKFLGVGRRVMFMDGVPDEALPKVYQMADVFVLPSLTAEAFGMVILEAMASGVPVVATRVGGIPEIVREGEIGILVPPFDELSLTEAIRRLLRDEELRRDFGEKGRKRAEEEYSWEIVAGKIERVYTEILESRRGC